MQHFVIKTFAEFVESAPAEGGLKSVLATVCDVYSHWRLLKYTGILYQGSTSNYAIVSG